MILLYKNWTVTPSQAFVGGCKELSEAIFNMVESYQADHFEAAIKWIANYVGTNFDDGISIHYVVINFKNLCWIF